MTPPFGVTPIPLIILPCFPVDDRVTFTRFSYALAASVGRQVHDSGIDNGRAQTKREARDAPFGHITPF